MSLIELLPGDTSADLVNAFAAARIAHDLGER
jgi:hypothetical protein